MLCPLYLAEISPPELRGTIMVIEQFSIVLGVVVGYWLGFFTRHSSLFFKVSLYSTESICSLGIHVLAYPPSCTANPWYPARLRKSQSSAITETTYHAGKVWRWTRRPKKASNI